MKRRIQTNSSALTACQREHLEAGFSDSGFIHHDLESIFTFLQAELSVLRRLPITPSMVILNERERERRERGLSPSPSGGVGHGPSEGCAEPGQRSNSLAPPA